MNIFTLDISNGLRDHEVGAGEYLLLIDAPPLANVTVKPNSQFGATGIPLKSGHDVRSRKEVNKWFISADAVAGGTIKILMSDSDEPLTINTVPSDVNVSEIGSIAAFGAAALAQLDKSANPYNISSTYSVSSTVGALVTLLNKTLSCDAIDISFSCGVAPQGNSPEIKILINGAIVALQSTQNVAYESSSRVEHISLYGVNGKTIMITGGNVAGYYRFATITEKTLKA